MVVMMMVEVKENLEFCKDIKVILEVWEMFQVNRTAYIELLGQDKYLGN